MGIIKSPIKRKCWVKGRSTEDKFLQNVVSQSPESRVYRARDLHILGTFHFPPVIQQVVLLYLLVLFELIPSHLEQTGNSIQVLALSYRTLVCSRALQWDSQLSPNASLSFLQTPTQFSFFPHEDHCEHFPAADFRACRVQSPGAPFPGLW